MTTGTHPYHLPQYVYPLHCAESICLNLILAYAATVLDIVPINAAATFFHGYAMLYTAMRMCQKDGSFETLFFATLATLAVGVVLMFARLLLWPHVVAKLTQGWDDNRHAQVTYVLLLVATAIGYFCSYGEFEDTRCICVLCRSRWMVKAICDDCVAKKKK